jgi:hypothetical protein
MVQRVAVELLDDIDASPATTTVTFGLDGRLYTIDLNDEHAAQLRGLLSRYAATGRRVGTRRSGTAAAAKARDFDPAAVRAWAASNGIKVSPRGRISAEVVEQYHAAGY